MTARPRWGHTGRVKGDAHYLVFRPQGHAVGPSPAAMFRTGLLGLACAWLSACGGSAGIRTGGSEAIGLGDDGYAESTPLSIRSNDVLMRAIGLVGFVFRDAAGVALPRSTRELIDIPAPKIDRDRLQPGDLVYFNPAGGRVSHIGIYVGEGRFVHAPSRGGTVRLDALGSDYWNRHYVGAKRVLQ